LIPDPFYIVVVGLLVGGLVSLSGLGGAVVLLPLLILALGVSPIVAVGSGTLFSAITKIGAAGLHWHRGNVDLRLVAAMAVGSIPGALLGLRLLVVLRAQYGEEVNALLTRVIALLLIIIPLLMLVQGRVLKPRPGPLRDSVSHRLTRYYGGTLTGLVGGLLVGVTSVGSGSVIIMILLLFYPLRPAVLIGTDIFHAVILTGVAGLGHLGLGTVDLRLVAWLLVGSLPGAYLGFKLIKVVPAVWLRRALLALLVVTGIIML
jgi:uncharacterized membrane protein YfcA